MRLNRLKNVPVLARALIRRPIFWIVLVCFVLRLLFVLSDAPTPVQFDARIYVSGALALPVALGHPSLFFDREARENISYDLVYADRLRGELVSWLYYDPPSFDDALESIFFAGPIYPGLLGLLFWPDWWEDFAAARTANAVFDAFSCALLFGILLMTAGRVAALLGAAFFAVYPGFIIKCGELNLEPLATLFTLSIVALCISAIVHRRPGRFFGAGLVAALLLLTKAASSALIVFLAMALVIILWRERQLLWRGLWRLGAGFALLALPWVILIWAYYGTPGVRDPQYGAANFRSSNMLADHGYDLDKARENFWTYPIGREMVAHPGGYFKLYAEKFYRLWNRSYNDYRIALLTGVDGQLWFHRLLVLVAPIGLFFWPTRAGRSVGLVAVAAIAYVSLTHTLWHSLTRYALPVVPLVLGAAAIGCVTIAGRLRRGMTFFRWGVFGLMALMTYLGWSWLNVGRVLALWGAVSPEAANILVTGIRAVILAGDVFLTCCFLGWSRRVVWLFGVVLLAGQVILWVKSLPRERWAEWSTPLCEESQVVERVIHFPPGYDWGKFQRVFMLLDIQSGGGEDFTLNLQLDTTLYRFDGGTYSRGFYPKPAYKPFLEAYGMKREQIRQWATFAFGPEKVAALLEDDRFSVRLWVSGGDQERNFIKIFGEYRPDDWHDWIGPTVINSSVERLYEEDDPRIWEAVPRELVAATNCRIDAGASDCDDLSPSPGQQTGDYRMMVVGMIAPRHYVYF